MTGPMMNIVTCPSCSQAHVNLVASRNAEQLLAIICPLTGALVPVSERVAPVRIRFESARRQIDRVVSHAMLVLPNADDPNQCDTIAQVEDMEQAAMLVANVIRYAVITGTIGRAMQIVATAPIVGKWTPFDASPPKPGEIPPDDLPPHLRGR